MINQSTWHYVNQKAIAKALREMIFEEITNVSESNGLYTLTTPNGVYTFSGTPGIWSDVRVDAASILKNGMVVTAAQFFIDTQSLTKMDDITLANFIEELHNSLYSDLRILELNQNVEAQDLAQKDGEQVQYYLQGHPKIINSKGRIGWSAAEQDQFGPENKKPVQFMWLAVRLSNLHQSICTNLNWNKIYLQSLSAEELSDFSTKVDLNSYRLLPVHPWQWDRHIRLQFLNELAHEDIIPLSVAGDKYLPQISLRTFSNISRTENCDIKLPLSILNTSSVRGIPSHYIAEGPELSHDLEQLCNGDKFLHKSKVSVLKELAGISLEQKDFKAVTDAPYRYHEFLGAIWRESSIKIRKSSNSLMTGALIFVDAKGVSLIEKYIEKSGIGVAEWISLYTRHVVLPLFHLQYKYGIGIVSHGQNIILELEGSKPSGVILKDFQGDLRLTETSTALKQRIPRLPAHYLIHDLITGHFITNLRYISGIIADRNMISEKDFYAIVGKEIQTYYTAQNLTPASPEIQSINLLAPIFNKVLVNAVRFKVGYADSSQRPVPMLGTNIINPFLNGVTL